MVRTVIGSRSSCSSLTPACRDSNSGVLDDKRTPPVTGGRQHPSAPGLFFTGYRTELSGQLRLMRFDARALTR